MKLAQQTMLEKFYARDAAWDGRFLAGVLSTGIYCLPSCGARKPKEANLRFFATPAEAEAAGFRACLRCRPDRFHRRYDPEREALLHLAIRIRKTPGAFASVDHLADEMAVSRTHLDELFHRFFHRSPSRFLTEARMDEARRLLAETGEGVAGIGAICGYESLSSFNANFRRLTGLSPREYRALPEKCSFTLTAPEGQVMEALRLQGRDASSPCEHLRGSTLAKAIMVGDARAVLSLSARDGAVYCRVDAPDEAGVDMFIAHDIALRLLGYSPDPSPFARFARNNPRLAALIAERPWLRIPQTATVFEGLTWAIIGQQINLPFAFRLRGELIRLAGRATGADLRAHPTPAEVAGLDYADLTQRRFSRRKAEYLIDAARSIVSGALPLDALPRLSADEAMDRLLAVRGIGVWSANYLGMRSCGFADCAPLGDTGLAAGLQRLLALPGRPDADEAGRLMEEFRPYRSFVTYHLWRMAGGAA